MTALAILGAVLGVIVVYDLIQPRHAILRNFPILGHFRYILEAVGPELRQYIVTSNDEERPFTRDQRRWVYASSKRENNYFGFGTDNDLEHAPHYLILHQATFPYAPPQPIDDDTPLPCAKVWGGPRGRDKAFRPASMVHISAMSFGSLSGRAIQALNAGAAAVGCLHNTGEGGISPHHLQGAPLIWQIGTGYFGCRTPQGGLDLDALVRACEAHPVKVIEIKLSQGAKPGRGGVLPGAKVTPEIAAIRGVPVGQTVYSPAGHSAFSSADELLDLVEEIAQRTGLPVGIKSAVGQLDFWHDLADLMATTSRGVDHIQIDGGEGGTGAAPLAWSDHVAVPFIRGFSRVYRIFAQRGVHEDLLWVGSGKLGFPERSMLALALGCDQIAVAREAMLSIGCIQAQRCHTGHCPTGVATQNPWLARGLDPTHKATRFANYVTTLRHDLLGLAHSCGVAHPGLVPLRHVEILDDALGGQPAPEVFDYEPGWGLPRAADQEAVTAIMDRASGRVTPR